MCKVSVIIPSFNHEKYIGTAIQSVLDQTYQDFELVITDDGSTDRSVDIIKSFSDKRIKLFIFDKNSGACAAANNCILNSSGEYIAMLSSDDFFYPDKLEKQVAFFDFNPKVGIVFGLPQMITEQGDPLSLVQRKHFDSIFNKPNRDRHEWLNHFFNHGNCLCHPSALIRRECYEKVGLYDRRFASLPDFDFWIRVCNHYDIHILKDRLIAMRWFDKDLNESGYNATNITRCGWEYKTILKHYLNLPVDKYNLIFPRYKLKNGVSNEAINLKIAKMALNKTNSHKIFAIEVLYELMKDHETVAELYNEVSFNFNDLITIAGNLDISSLGNQYSSAKKLFILFVKQFIVEIKIIIRIFLKYILDRGLCRKP